MEELKLLIKMVADLPQMALWVALGYFVYKVAVIGSIYGLARFFIDKLHSWLVTPKEKLVEVKYEIGPYFLGSHSMSDLKRALATANEKVGGKESYHLHRNAIQFMIDAINEKEKRP